MGDIITHELKDSILTITMDDGKVNVLSPAMQSGIKAGLDEAEAAKAVVIITGRPGMLSAGFDLNLLRTGSPDAVGMLFGGFRLAERLLSFPLPVIIACPGHAVAMGSFLLLSVDYRIGASGAFRIQANEVAIGLPMPFSAIEISRQRLAPAHFHRAIGLAEAYSPEDAVAAGWLDRVVPPESLMDAARETAAGFLKLSLSAHHTSKLRAREQSLKAIRAAIEADEAMVPGASAS